MINLLPPETKKQIRAARINVVLINYCLLATFTALLLGGVFAVGFWADMSSRNLAEQGKKESEQATAAYADTRKQAEEFARDLGIAKTILASEVSFGKLILDIAGYVPRGVILSNLSLGTTTTKGPIDITGRADSTDAAVALKNSLENSPIFEKVNIFNIQQTDTSALVEPDPVISRYPFVINLKAEYTKSTPPPKEGTKS
jgi:Tfp pilus assembly protein PilN